MGRNQSWGTGHTVPDARANAEEFVIRISYPSRTNGIIVLLF